MRERLDLQKDLFHRILRLHALRSRDENFELLQLAVDDTLIFDLAYHQIMERLSGDESVDTTRSGAGGVVVVCTGQILYWLSSNRSLVLSEINTIVDALGGIEIVSYLVEERQESLCQFD